MRTLFLLPLLAAPAGAQVARVTPAPFSAVAAPSAASIAALSFAPPLSTTLSAASAPLAAPAAAAAAAPDREAALVEKLAARLCSSDCVTRGKTAAWIGELAAQHPRESVQAAAVRGLAEDAVASRNLAYFEKAAGVIEAVASATEHDAVFEDAVRRLVDAARISGQAQRAQALAAAERIGRAGGAARRTRAAELIAVLRGDQGFRLDGDELERLISRVRGS